MKRGDIITCFLMIQGVALVGSVIFGFIADKVGKRRAILGSFPIWIFVLVCALIVHSPAGFWGMGATIGLVLGGTQAASRSLMSEMTPSARAAEFFGFYSFSGKLSSAIGPAICGVVKLITGSMRFSIFSLILLFIAGGILLWTVNEKRAITAAGTETL
jgi:UMF1 family MFS transporter